MKNHVNKIISVFILLISFALTGCYYYEPSGDIIEIGFKTKYMHDGPLFGGIRSKTNTFEIDDVILDFYVGGETDLKDFQSVVLYLAHEQNRAEYIFGKDENNQPTTTPNPDFLSPPKVEEYRTTKGYYFMDEIDCKTFINGPFDVSIRFGYKVGDYYFHFVRRLTIPKELFKEQSGRIAYIVALLPKDDEEIENNKNDIIKIPDELYFKYTILDDGKVLIE